MLTPSARKLSIKITFGGCLKMTSSISEVFMTNPFLGPSALQKLAFCIQFHTYCHKSFPSLRDVININLFQIDISTYYLRETIGCQPTPFCFFLGNKFDKRDNQSKLGQIWLFFIPTKNKNF